MIILQSLGSDALTLDWIEVLTNSSARPSYRFPTPLSNIEILEKSLMERIRMKQFLVDFVFVQVQSNTRR